MTDSFWDDEYGIVSEPSVLDRNEANDYADEDDYRDEE